MAQAAQRLLQEFDPEHGGLGGAPKFPRSLELGFLLHYYRLSGDAQVLDKLAFTLEKMARGGIYDQLGGGFHRYTVDAAWVVPHFEKMLYDNALLAPLYLAYISSPAVPWAGASPRRPWTLSCGTWTRPRGASMPPGMPTAKGWKGSITSGAWRKWSEVLGPETAPLVGRGPGGDPGGEF